MESVIMYKLMIHSIRFTENELLILNKISVSPILISRYDLSNKGRDKKNRLEIDVATVSKTCKKLVAEGILEEVIETNEKNVPKKVLKFSLYGFCLFVSQGKSFSFQSVRIAETIVVRRDRETKTFDDQMNILKKWKYLHESFDWTYSFILEMVEKDAGFRDFLLIDLWERCKKVARETTSKIFYEPIPGRFIERQTFLDIAEQIDIQLYEEIFKGFEFLNDLYPKSQTILTEVCNIIKKSDKGRPIIKKYIEREIVRYKVLKEIDKLL